MSTEQCECGTFAIGRCSKKGCGRLVCGDHSGLWDAKRLCSTHLGEAKQSQLAARAAADAENRDAALNIQAAMEEARERKAGEQRAIEERLQSDAADRRRAIDIQGRIEQLLSVLLEAGSPGTVRVDVVILGQTSRKEKRALLRGGASRKGWWLACYCVYPKFGSPTGLFLANKGDLWIGHCDDERERGSVHRRLDSMLDLCDGDDFARAFDENTWATPNNQWNHGARTSLEAAVIATMGEIFVEQGVEWTE